MQFCVVYARCKLNVVLNYSLNGTSKYYWKTARSHYKSKMDEASKSRENSYFSCRLIFDEITYNFEVIILTLKIESGALAK